MTTSLLLLRKDLRLLRVPIAAWLGVLALQVLLTLSRLDVGAQVDLGFEPWGMAAGTLNFAHFVLIALLATGVAQADPPAAPTAFWVTRPIARRSLMAAKLLFGFVVVVAPWTLAHVVTLAGRGFTAVDIAAGLPWLTAQQVLLLLACLAIGALTERLPHAVVALVGLGTLLAAAMWAAVTLRRELFAELRAVGRPPEEVAALVAIALAFAATGCAYARRSRLAMALVVAGGPLAVGVLHFGPSQDAAPLAPLPASIALEAQDTGRPATAQVNVGGTKRAARWGVTGTMAVTGAAEGARVRVLQLTSDVSWPGGRRERAAISLEGRPAPSSSMPLMVAGLGEVTNLTPEAPLWLAAVSPRTWGEAATAGQAGVASPTVELRLVHARALARMALQRDAHSEVGSERIVVTEASAAEGRVVVHEFGLGARLGLGRLNGPVWRELVNLRYYAFYNSGRRELIAARPVSGRILVTPATAAGARIERYGLELETPFVAADHFAWLAGAELVKIEETAVAQGERRLQGRPLLLGPAPPDLR